MDLEQLLETRRSSATQFEPEIIDASEESGRERLQQVLEEPAVEVCDSLEVQLGDYLKSEQPNLDWNPENRAKAIAERLGGAALAYYGRWIYYPWSRQLVHVLPPDEFVTLRTHRNRYKILPEAQQMLRGKRIAVAGLSVGQTAALTLVMEGIGGHFHVADFDELSLSNLNRLRAGVDKLGINKSILAAREMYGTDPYIKVVPFDRGVQDDNIEQFFHVQTDRGMEPIDLLVEECDDLHMKIRLRERARELGIPVIMDTSDRGLLDIERFDLEPNREILHGRIPGLRSEELRGLTTKQKVPYVLGILGADTMGIDLAASLPEVDQTISSWPQLASAVTLGGALVAHSARKIFQGGLTESGRFYVDLDTLVCDGAAQPDSEPVSFDIEVAREARELHAEPAVPPTSIGAPTEAEVEYLVSHAIMAPSPGNMQAWHFHGGPDGQIRCRVDPQRTSFLDYNYLASFLALGAAVENITIAGAQCGLNVTTKAMPQGEDSLMAAELSLDRAPKLQSQPLFPSLRMRCTNRKQGKVEPLADAHRAALMRSVDPAHGRVQIVTDPEKMQVLARVIGGVDRMRMLSETLHRELYSEIRWSAKDAVTTRDGVDLATVEATPTDVAAMQVLARPSVRARLAEIDGGETFVESTLELIEASSALVLVCAPGQGRSAFFHGGRQFQRLWLTATQHSLAVQPQGVVLYLNQRRAGGGEGLSEAEQALLAQYEKDMDTVFPIDRSQETAVMMFRVSYADAPSAFSLRRPLDEVFFPVGQTTNGQSRRPVERWSGILAPANKPVDEMVGLAHRMRQYVLGQIRK